MEWGSMWRGLVAWKPRRQPVNYAIRRVWRGYPIGSATRASGFWVHAWTPTCHEGRGPYVSIGLGWVALYRGY